MNALHAFVFGIVEGLTEFLPVSSTGHLILSERLMGLAHGDFLGSFEIAIQLGAILAVVCLYWKKLILDIEIIKRITVAFIPTAILGLAFYKIIKKVLLGSENVVLWSLLVGGIIIIVFELLRKEKDIDIEEIKELSYKKSFMIGVFQSFAMIPGVSRSAATIIGGLSLGLKRRTIVEFSFLLAVPTMAAATALDLLKSASSFTVSQFGLLFVGFVVSFFVAILAIKFLLHFVKNHNFIIFGVYRIIIAGLFLIF
ncbi:MAG: undecaprenyl-diphosphate phosphatase [Candidatus Omnitrophica bacterium]|nr:undecaprenyl-diphosphate phosphatase [Candidatus Omnitrophota bacterium]